MKPNFSTLGRITEISKQDPLISCLPDDSIRNLLGFNASTIYEAYNLSPNPVDIVPFDNIFFESDIAQCLIFECRRTGNIHNWTMAVDPGYNYAEKFAGGISW